MNYSKSGNALHANITEVMDRVPVQNIDLSPLKHCLIFNLKQGL